MYTYIRVSILRANTLDRAKAGSARMGWTTCSLPMDGESSKGLPDTELNACNLASQAPKA